MEQTLKQVISDAESAYDAVFFPKEPRFWSEPAYSAAAAHLFGVPCRPVDRARILEIGCASGGNILPMAARYPKASFIGIDISGRQIADAQHHANELGLENLQLLHMDIQDGPAALGTFDYVIAHGFYSWIPIALHETLWRFCTEALSESGLLYLSYNTLPYWHLKSPLRDMLRFHGRETSDRTQALKDGLLFVAEVAKHGFGVFGQVMTDELALIADQNPRLITHDQLAEENHPVYFSDLAAEAQAHGLTYVSEATPTYSSLRMLKAEVAASIIRYAGDDRALREQYIDFFTGRAFRRSLFVKKVHAPVIPLDILPSRVDDLHIVFKELPPSLDFSDASRELFFLDDASFNSSVQTPGNQVAGAAISHLSAVLPQLTGTLPVRQILETLSAQTHGDEALIDMVRGAILEYFYQRKIAFSTVPFSWTYDATRPQAQHMIVSDAAHGRESTVNVVHDEILLVKENGRLLLALLDGTKSRAELDDAVFALYQAGRLVLPSAPDQEQSEPALRAMVLHYLDVTLLRFAALRVMTSG